MSSKYNVGDKENRTYGEIIFDSALEMKYYKEVILPGIENGEIVDFQLQKPYVLIPSFRAGNKKYRDIKYVCDFYVVYKNKKPEVIDVKGMPTSEAELKRKLFAYFYPNENLVWMYYCKKYGGWIDYDQYIKLKRAAKKKKSKVK